MARVVQIKPGDTKETGPTGRLLFEGQETAARMYLETGDRHSAALILDDGTVDWPLKDARHPMQPIVADEHGVHRFKCNAIVRHLLDNGTIDLNMLSRLDFSTDDWGQFYQLIGYSVCGYCDIDVVSEESKDAAMAESERLLKVNYGTTD